MKTVRNMCHMKFSMRLVALVLVFGASQEVWAAQQKENDSVYRWGRWAVLSPAAGGDSYKSSVTPDAANNARPGDAVEFQPEVASIGVPPGSPLQPPVVTPNPPGTSPPPGDPRGPPVVVVVPPPVVTPNPPGISPPPGDPRGSPVVVVVPPPVVAPNPPGPQAPPVGDPRG